MGWSRFLGPLSADERANPLQSYYARLLSPDVNVRSEAVSAGIHLALSRGAGLGALSTRVASL
jgi:hypothetical protein